MRQFSDKISSCLLHIEGHSRQKKQKETFCFFGWKPYSHNHCLLQTMGLQCASCNLVCLPCYPSVIFVICNLDFTNTNP